MASGTLAAVLVGCPGPAAAAPGEIKIVSVMGRLPGAELQVRGQPVARLFGRRAFPRLQEAARRLDPLLPPPTAVAVQVAPASARLVVDGVAVLEAIRSDAARAGLAPADLAGRWAAALQQALAVVPIVSSRPGVVLSPGRTESVSLSTVTAEPLTLGGYDQSVVSVKMVGSILFLTGKAVGSTVVPIRAGPYRAQVAVSVRQPTGVVPPGLEVVVTGNPAPADLVRQAIERRLEAAIVREPGSTMQFGEIGVGAPLAPGASIDVPVAVALRSPYAGPVDATIMVTARNVSVHLTDPDVLLVSNRPETITGSGMLFQEVLAEGKTARLLYHHLNGTPGQMRVLKITLGNPGAIAARVHYLSGHAGPSGDPLAIGYASTARFMDALVGGRGYMVEIPARGTATFTARTMPPLALVSGLMQFQVIEGGPVELTVHVRLPWLLDRTVTTDLGGWAFPHPRGTFPGAVVDIAREVSLLQPSVVADLGVMSNLRDVRTDEPLVGDYGVLYRLRLRLLNPTDREASAALVASAAGGPARGLFLVDNAAVDAGLLRPAEERQVAAFVVPPSAHRQVMVLTMPVAGSFYPVRLAVKPR